MSPQPLAVFVESKPESTPSVTVAGRGVAHVLIEDVRLNDLSDDHASMSAFWSAMPPDGSSHRDITFRRIVAMRTTRDGVNVHGNVVGWTGVPCGTQISSGLASG